MAAGLLHRGRRRGGAAVSGGRRVSAAAMVACIARRERSFHKHDVPATRDTVQMLDAVV